MEVFPFRVKLNCLVLDVDPGDRLWAPSVWLYMIKFGIQVKTAFWGTVKH